MTDVEIEYCVPCGMLNRAQDVQTALLEQFGQRLDTVALRTGDDGVFRVAVDDQPVFDVDDDEYDVEAIVEDVGAHV